MSTKTTIFEKIDGLKITAWRNKNPYGRFEDNWVIAYKNFIIFEEEFIPHTEPIQYDQFKIVLDRFRALHEKSNDSFIIPGTEFFLEFACDKATLMQTYNGPALFLLGWAASDGETIGGYLQTKPDGFQNVTHQYQLVNDPRWNADILVPPQIFHGIPDSIFDGNTAPVFHTPLARYEAFKQHILRIPSCIGPRIEGGIGWTINGAYKILQPEQTDKAARTALRNKHRHADPEKETAYWAAINNFIDNFVKPIDKPLAVKLRIYRSWYDHTGIAHGTLAPLFALIVKAANKPRSDIINDIYITTRLRLLKELPENQNGLIVGRFQTLTRAHTDMIRMAAAKHHIVWVAVVNGAVTSKDNQLNPLNFPIRKRLIEALGLPNVRVIEVPTGSVRNIISSIPSGITALYCGTDRMQQYQLAVKHMNVQVIEIPRVSPISGTQLRAAIRENNKQAYTELTDPALAGYYEEIKKWLMH